MPTQTTLSYPMFNNKPPLTLFTQHPSPNHSKPILSQPLFQFHHPIHYHEILTPILNTRMIQPHPCPHLHHPPPHHYHPLFKSIATSLPPSNPLHPPLLEIASFPSSCKYNKNQENAPWHPPCPPKHLPPWQIQHTHRPAQSDKQKFAPLPNFAPPFHS